MSTNPDLFEQINNAVLDLQSAQYQSYDRPLKTLEHLLKSPELVPYNEQLTDRLDLDAFLAENEPRGGMIGGDKLVWPVEPEKVLGLTLLLIERFAEKPHDMASFGHTYYYTGRKIISDVRAVTSQVVIPFARDYKAYVMSHSSSAPARALLSSHNNKVFIVHGHDGEAREAVARYLEKIGFAPIILHEQANRGRTVIEKVEANSDVGFAVVLLTPDDEGCKKGETPEPRARQNVLLELGYFIGKLGRDRVCAFQRGTVNIPSDFAGVVWTVMDESNGWKQELARELSAAGYAIDWNTVMK